MQAVEKELDRNYLLNCYQNMTDELGEIFELFLLETEPAILKIITLITTNDLIGAEEELHKIAPSFCSVGLPQLTLQISIADAAVKAGEQIKASKLIVIFYAEFKTYLPAVKKEIMRLNQLKQYA